MTTRIQLESDLAAVAAVNPLPVTALPAASGGYDVARVISAASNNATSVKATPGQVFGWYIFNKNASIRYLKLYNKASAPAPATDAALLVATIPIPASTDGAGAFGDIVAGLAFSTGIALSIVSEMADTDNTSVGAEDCAVNLFYK